MKELFLFVRPPRPNWPFCGPTTGIWPPLAFATLAAALREAIGDLRVEILDAPALGLDFEGLVAEIRSRRPEYVGIGEEGASSTEGLRAAAAAKECGARVVAGGCFFGHLAEEVVRTGLVDAVVRGEGEVTIVELLEALRARGERNLRRVRGITFRDGEEIVSTPARDLIPELDRLPFPAYDLLSVERYGRGSRNHPALAAVELSRGCDASCEFCVLWRQMGRFQGSRVLPCLRTKSAERALEEVRILIHRFGRRYLGWVDPCFNADPDTPGRLAEGMLREGLNLGQSAWMRADGIVRDHASGALSACIRSGLNEAYIGIERTEADDLRSFRKPVTPGIIREAFGILKRHHPGVFRLGSFIYGLPEDTPRTLRAIYRLSGELDLDMAFYIPLTGLPGTPFWDPAGEGLGRLDFLPSLSRNGHLGRLERALFRAILLDWRVTWLRRNLTRLFSPDGRRRRLSRRLILRSIRFWGSRIIHPLS